MTNFTIRIDNITENSVVFVLKYGTGDGISMTMPKDPFHDFVLGLDARVFYLGSFETEKDLKKLKWMYDLGIGIYDNDNRKKIKTIFFKNKKKLEDLKKDNE